MPGAGSSADTRIALGSGPGDAARWRARPRSVTGRRLVASAEEPLAAGVAAAAGCCRKRWSQLRPLAATIEQTPPVLQQAQDQFKWGAELVRVCPSDAD